MKLDYKSKIFIFCIIYIFFYGFLLINIPEWFPFAFELGDITYRLCFAFTTGYIFYLLVTFLPRKADKKNIYFFADIKKDKITSHFNHFLTAIINHINELLTNQPKNIEVARKKALAELWFENSQINKDNLTENDFKNILTLINPNQESPFSIVQHDQDAHSPFKPISWSEKFNSHSHYIKKEILELFSVMPYLSTKHVKILSQILESDFINYTQDTKYFNLADNLEHLGPSMFKYHELIKNLENNWESSK